MECDMLVGERAVGESQRGRRRSTMFGVKIHINMVEKGGGGSGCSEYTAGGRGGEAIVACRRVRGLLGIQIIRRTRAYTAGIIRAKEGGGLGRRGVKDVQCPRTASRVRGHEYGRTV